MGWSRVEGCQGKLQPAARGAVEQRQHSVCSALRPGSWAVIFWAPCRNQKLPATLGLSRSVGNDFSDPKTVLGATRSQVPAASWGLARS